MAGRIIRDAGGGGISLPLRFAEVENLSSVHRGRREGFVAMLAAFAGDEAAAATGRALFKRRPFPERQHCEVGDRAGEKGQQGPEPSAARREKGAT